MLCSRLSIGVNVCHDRCGVGWAVHMRIQPLGWMTTVWKALPLIFSVMVLSMCFLSITFVYFSGLSYYQITNTNGKDENKPGGGKERQKFINQKITRIHNGKTPTSGIICDCFWKMIMVWVYRHNEAAKEVFITNQKKKGRNSLIFYLCGGLFMSAKS